MKKLSFLVLYIACSVLCYGQNGFTVSGSGEFSVGQMFATPAAASGVGSVSPGVQNANLITVDMEDDRCEGYAYTENGFNLPATANPVDTVLVNYDPDVRSYLGYDSITTMALTIHLTQHSMDTTVFMADYDDPRFGTASGHQDVTYHTSDFGCDSVVDLLVYRMTAIPDVEETALPGYYTWPVTMSTPAFEPSDFYAAGGTLTPSSDPSYTDEYPTGATTPVVWTATIADSTASFTQQVKINEPDCSSLTPVDGSGNTYEVVRIIHDCWLKKSLRSELYADGTTPIPDVRNYPGADVDTYGLLYSYDAATGYGTPRNDTLQGACPNGWHLPTEEKVMEVMAYYDATELMSTENWVSPGSNLSTFTMQPSGFYDSSSPFPYQGLFTVGIFWIYSPGSTVYYACEFGYACGSTEIIPGSATKSFSVRCLKDRE